MVLGIALFWKPYSPRWLVEYGREDEAKLTLSYLRNSPAETPEVVTEYLEIKDEVMIQRELKAISTAGKGGLRAAIQPYLDLFSSWSNFHRLYIGCTAMFFQQFIGCNAIFAQLGLDPNTTSLLATGVYGITNRVFTLPADLFLDRVGSRLLLLVGAVGSGFSHMFAVGSLAAAYVLARLIRRPSERWVQ